MAGTIDFTLRLAGDYRVRRFRQDGRPWETLQPISIRDTSAAARLAAEEDLDYLVLGRLDSTDQGGILFEIALWDRAEEAYTIRLEAIAESLFDTFDVADDLTVEILSAMTGRRIAFGTIAVQPEPAGGGTGTNAFLAFIDGQYTGQNLTRMESIPAGERRVDILPLTDDPRSARRHTDRVTLPPDGIVTVRYPAAAVTHPWFVPRLIAFEEYDDQDRGQDRDQSPEAALASNRPIPTLIDEGFNRDRGLWRTTVVREVIHADWFHQPARWESNAARYPVVDWRIDGALDEWPRGTQVYRIDPERERDAFVRVSELGLTYAPDAILVFVVLDGDWEQFLRNSEPAIYLGATVTGDGPSRLRYAVRRESRRWRVEGRENRTPYSEHPFRSLRGGQAATDGSVVEIRIPLDRFDHIREMEINEIGLEYKRGNDFEVAFQVRL